MLLPSKAEICFAHRKHVSSCSPQFHSICSLWYWTMLPTALLCNIHTILSAVMLCIAAADMYGSTSECITKHCGMFAMLAGLCTATSKNVARKPDFLALPTLQSICTVKHTGSQELAESLWHFIAASAADKQISHVSSHQLAVTLNCLRPRKLY